MASHLDHKALFRLPISPRRRRGRGGGLEALTPAERSLRARLAAHALHASHDSRELTAKARETFRNSFYNQTDPALPHEEHLRRAHFARMALASAKARRRRAS